MHVIHNRTMLTAQRFFLADSSDVQRAESEKSQNRQCPTHSAASCGAGALEPDAVIAG